LIFDVSQISQTSGPDEAAIEVEECPLTNSLRWSKALGQAAIEDLAERFGG
jgi:hypothetical protein